MDDLDIFLASQRIQETAGVKHICPLCSKPEYVVMHYEPGGWFYNCEEDINCPHCSTAMEILGPVRV